MDTLTITARAIVDGKAFKAAVTDAARVCTTKARGLNTSLLLIEVGWGTLTVIACDAEIEKRVEIEASVPSTGDLGSFLVDPKAAKAALKGVGDAIVIRADQAACEINGQRITLPEIRVDQFCRVQAPAAGVDQRTVPARFFAEVKRTVIGPNRDMVRPMTCSYFLTADPDTGRAVLTGTDSYRITVRTLDQDPILYAETPLYGSLIDEAARLAGPVTVTGWGYDRPIQITNGPVTLVARSGHQESYKLSGIRPTGGERFTVNRAQLIDAVNGAKACYLADRKRQGRPVSGEARPVRLRFEGGRGVALDNDTRVESDPFDTDNTSSIDVAFDADYLVEGLTPMPGDNVVVELISPIKPARFVPAADPSVEYILMPIRVP